MSDTAQAAPAQGEAPTPLDLTAYTEVVIVKTDTIDDHEYKRGQRHMVDANLYALLDAAGMILKR